MEFLRFWRHCLFEGWHIGEGIFAWIEGLCFLAWAGTLWLKKSHKLRESWESWEEKIMKLSFGLFLIAFVCSTFFIAPYLQFVEAKQAKEIADPVHPVWTQLSPDDARLVSEALWKCQKRPVSILWAASDSDARMFGQQLVKLFTGAGFTVGVSKGLCQGSEGRIHLEDPEKNNEPMKTVLKKVATASNRQTVLGDSNSTLSFIIGTP
jgi:hypothetical protein